MTDEDLDEVDAAAGAPVVGLRERRRAELASAITDATLDLFEERGVDHTTVADIAAAVGISSRTFFRYFPSKEVAALSGQHAFQEVMLTMIANLRTDESVLSQLVSAFRSVTVDISAQADGVRKQLVRVQRLLIANPGMRAASLNAEEDGNIRLAGMIHDAAPLEGGLQEARAIVYTATYGLRLAFEEWVLHDGRPDAAPLPEVYDRVIRMMNRVHSVPS